MWVHVTPKVHVYRGGSCFSPVNLRVIGPTSNILQQTESFFSGIPLGEVSITKPGSYLIAGGLFLI